MTASATRQDYELYVGIDIAAQTATVAWQTPEGRVSQPLTIEPSSAGQRTLQQHLTPLGVAPPQTLVVMEATGVYWIRLALALQQAGYAVSVINPAQAHYFAQATLQAAKTDALDAQMLARLAAHLRPTPWTPPPAIYADLQQRLAQRDDLVGIRQQLRNQRHALEQQPRVIESVRTRLTDLIATLDEQIHVIEAELAEVIEQDHPWTQTIRRLDGIKGVGLLTAAWIVVTTLNFSVCTSPEEATAYAGLAPRPHQSGTSVRGRSRIGHRGNARLRTALYMATLSGAWSNPLLKTFYERLLAKGKLVKVARCAVARKLLHIAWAVATKKREFDPTYGQLSASDPHRV
jgi:transposase